MDTIGARWNFRVGSAIALVTFVFYMILQRFMPPVKFITHDDQKDPEVTEPLKGENGEIKPQVKSQIEAKQLSNDEVEKLDDTANQELENNEETHAHVGNNNDPNVLKD